MTIAEALDRADELKESLHSIRVCGGHLTDIGIMSAENTIEALERIIFWYDRNQRKLIKALATMVKEKKVMK